MVGRALLLSFGRRLSDGHLVRHLGENERQGPTLADRVTIRGEKHKPHLKNRQPKRLAFHTVQGHFQGGRWGTGILEGKEALFEALMTIT